MVGFGRDLGGSSSPCSLLTWLLRHLLGLIHFLHLPLHTAGLTDMERESRKETQEQLHSKARETWEGPRPAAPGDKQRVASAVSPERLRQSAARLGWLGTPGTWCIRALQGQRGTAREPEGFGEQRINHPLSFW